MHDGYFAVGAVMGMSVHIIGLSMSCPACVCYTDCTGSVFGFTEVLKVVYLAMCLVDMKISGGIYQCHAGAVISAVFQSV